MRNRTRRATAERGQAVKLPAGGHDSPLASNSC